MGKVTVSFEGSTTSKTAVQLSHDKKSKNPIQDVPSEDSTTPEAAVEWNVDKESSAPIKDVILSSEDSATPKPAVERYVEKDRRPIKDAKVSSDDSAGTMAAVNWFMEKDRQPTKDVKVSFEDSAGTMAADDWFTDRYLYMDCSINEYVEGDFDNLWTTAATFIVLFLLSVVYGAAVTLVKVKWFLSRLVQYELEREFITVLDQPTS